MKARAKTRLLAVLLGAILVTGLLPSIVPAAQAANFSDVTDPTMLEAVQLLANLGVITAAESYRPNVVLDKASYCKLAVDIAGVENIDQYRDYTIFPDVRANHWALPYINAAVKSTELRVSGRPDGSFGPGNPVTYNEVATMLVRLLGYSEAELGYNWPRNYVNKANALGLSKGMDVTGTITRGQAAIMFYNLLFSPIKTADDASSTSSILFIDRMKKLQTAVEDAVIIDVNGLSEDGKKRGLVVNGGDGFYLLRSSLDSSLAGRRGTLLADADGYLVRFTPDTQSSKTIYIKSSAAGSVTDKNNVTTSIPATAVVYSNGAASTFGASWATIKSGDSFVIFYKGSGAIDYIIWGHDGTDSTVITTAAKGAAAISSAFGIPAASVMVVKNGVPVTPEAIAPYDTLSYASGSNRVSVSSLRLTMRYEGGQPYNNAPESIVIGSTTCTLSENATMQAGQFAIGDWVTVCIASDGTIGGVYAASKVASNAFGVALSSTSVEFANGFVLSGATSHRSVFKGVYVVASGTASGLDLAPAGMRGASASYTDNKLGTTSVADWCKFYTKNGVLVAPIDKSDIKLSTVPANRIKHCSTDANGLIDTLIIEDITADAAYFGHGSVVLEEGNAKLSLDVGGEKGEYAVGSVVWDKTAKELGYIGAIFEVKQGELVLTKMLPTLRTTIDATAFSGTDHAIVNGAKIPIAEDCKLLSGVGGTYLPLSQLPQYLTGSMYVFYDTIAPNQGKIRMIVLNV